MEGTGFYEPGTKLLTSDAGGILHLNPTVLKRTSVACHWRISKLQTEEKGKNCSSFECNFIVDQSPPYLDQ